MASSLQLTLNFLKQTFTEITTQIGFPATIWLAYSGGVDSHALLHMLHQLSLQLASFKLRAIHVHHGLSVHADQWTKHCQLTCEALTIPCHLVYIDAKAKPGESPEAAARAARYEALAKIIPDHDWLVTAHHQDDQAETLLLQLLRGAGSAGLAAMPAYSMLGKAWLVRPLLAVSRSAIMAYAQQQDLNWVEDESNQQTHFDRNYVRHQIVPLLRRRWPSATQSLARSANHCASAAELANELAQRDLMACKHANSHNALSITALLQLSSTRCANVLRYWLKHQHLAIPSTAQLQQLRDCVLLAAPTAVPNLQFAGTIIRRYRDLLYAAPLKNIPKLVAQPWDLNHDLVLSPGKLTVQWALGQGLRRLNKDELAQLQVRAPYPGERMHPLGRMGSHPLKKLFQKWGVPPWLRSQTPLVCCGEVILAVPGYAIAAAYNVHVNEPGWTVQYVANA